MHYQTINYYLIIILWQKALPQTRMNISAASEDGDKNISLWFDSLVNW